MEEEKEAETLVLFGILNHVWVTVKRLQGQKTNLKMGDKDKAKTLVW